MCEENTARAVLVRAARSVLLHPELVHAGESIRILRLNLLPAIKIRQRPTGRGELRPVAQEEREVEFEADECQSILADEILD
jgi:hypothetical protein